MGTNIAISAIQICAWWALALAPTSVLIRRECLSDVKKLSICQRSQRSVPMPELCLDGVFQRREVPRPTPEKFYVGFTANGLLIPAPASYPLRFTYRRYDETELAVFYRRVR